MPDAIPEERAVCALWDLDNVTTRRRYLAQLADALSGVVGPEAFRVAAAQRITFRSSRAMLSERGFDVLSGGRRASGADRQLLARARALRRQGVRRFVLISNDGDFAKIAGLGELVVLTPNAAQLSAKLVAAASQVRELVFEDGHWSIRPPQPLESPLSNEGAVSTSTPSMRAGNRHSADVDVEAWQMADETSSCQPLSHAARCHGRREAIVGTHEPEQAVLDAYVQDLLDTYGEPPGGVDAAVRSLFDQAQEPDPGAPAR